MLNLRMILYFLFAGLASQGMVVFDGEADTVTFRIEDLAMVLSGSAAFVATFVSGRIAKARGGKT